MRHGQDLDADIYEDLVIAGLSEPPLTALELQVIAVARIDARERLSRLPTIRRLTDLFGVTRRRNKLADLGLEELRCATLTILKTPAHAMQQLLAMGMTDARARAVLAALGSPPRPDSDMRP